MTKTNSHKPVLLDEALAGLAIKPSGTYLDCTFGRGGHSRAILGKLDDKGRLIAIDRDPEAVAAAQADLGDDPRFCICRGTFGKITDIVRRQGMTGLVNGLLMDLGVSSPQLDDPARGFSFSSDGPLDMRMSPDEGISAADWLAKAEEREISQVLFRYGEERQARRIARAIVEARSVAPIRTTGRLAEIIGALVPAHQRKRHPATKTFQAIRIYINKELQELEQCLTQSIDLLARDGRLCVISFHSLEDRIVKRFMRAQSKPDPVYAGLPEIPPEAQPKLALIGKAIKAKPEEVVDNARSRSAVLRIAEKL
ncbi:MAG: 16S rRNA (cytosine(1402)-N(4))-methyltransferase RsmH [Gammaproteobacteria bacterium]|nr:16S rRNA (cytosine(1402)-N(4))-methyltransferase RsmH [Gammaproteobacteria bacterium]